MFISRSYIIYISLLFFTSVSVSAQQVAINEVMASNARTISDEDGDYSDWIELYNYGDVAVSLAGYGLSDNPENLFKWVFPDVTIDAGEFLMVWASGKNRRPAPGAFAKGLVREVYSGIPGSSVTDLTNHPKYPNNPDITERITHLFEAPTNVGDNYGQRVHGWIKAPATGLYTFWISGDDNCELHISHTADPAFARLIASVPGWTTPREWGKYTEQRSGFISMKAGEYYYIKALMKEQAGGDNLAVGWQLPGGTMERPIAGRHLFSGEASLHTSFSISAAGEDVLLTRPDSLTISRMDAIAMTADVSRGRVPDGAGDWFFFAEPTPGGPNNTSAYNELLTPPAFSAPAGFYSGAFGLALTHPNEEVQIIYTMDGSMPDLPNLEGISYPYKNQYAQSGGHPFGELLSASYRTYYYNEALLLRDRSAEPDRMTQISSTWHRTPSYFPLAPVKKATVVRARAVKPGAIPSPVITNSYFIGGQGANPYTLPLISIAVQEDALFDYYDGIYVAGETFDNWRLANPSSGANGGTIANYWLSGIATEKPAHFEYFEDDAATASLSQDIGVRLHGGWSRAHPQKSLRLYARGEYGPSTFDYPFFNERPHDVYKRLVLRNSGNDYFNTFLRDAATHRIMAPLRFDIQAYQPSVVFINGEYWGIHNIRERYDKHFIGRMYGVDPENIDLLENNGGIIEGDADHYNALLAYLESHSPASQARYDYIRTQMDVENFADYEIANIFAANTDWPGNNIKFWRLRTAAGQPDAPHGHDGRWRWMMYDTDFGFGLVGGVGHNTMHFATQANGPGWPNPPWSTYVLRKLLENTSFKNYFINRFADLLNTVLLPARTTDIINSMKLAIEPEMPEHQQRWRGSAGGNIGSWNSQVNTMINFANQRPANQRVHIRSYFGIASTMTVTVDVNHPDRGGVRVNTIDIVPETPGVAANPYPWTGTYFRGIPIEVEAMAKHNYRFSHWEGGGGGNSALLNINPSGNIALKAIFVVSDTLHDEPLHYWHFNDLPLTNIASIPADYSAMQDTPGLITYPGAGNGYMDRVDGTTLNAWDDAPAAYGLRVRNPSDTRSLIIEAPSTGYKDLSLSFAVQRTNNGAREQLMHFSADGGQTWQQLGDPYGIEPEYTLRNVDLTQIAAANNNPGLQFRITFQGDDAGGDSGNNRFDNLMLKGLAIGTSMPERPSPGESLMLGNFPNPFGGETTLRFYLAPGNRFQRLEVIDLSGRIVARIDEIPEAAGEVQLPFNGAGLQPGVYLLRLHTSMAVGVHRMMKSEK